MIVLIVRDTIFHTIVYTGSICVANSLHVSFYSRKIPSVLEYFSYNFCFLTILAGPATTYKEYIDFITGRNVTDMNGKVIV